MAYTIDGKEKLEAWRRAVAPVVNRLLGADPARHLEFKGNRVFAPDPIFEHKVVAVAKICDHYAPRGTVYGYSEGAPPETLEIILDGSDCSDGKPLIGRRH